MLTDKQERFCQEYIIDLNATQAAIRSGYSIATARTIASEIMTKLDIQERIQELQKLRSERLQITQDDVLREFWSIAKDDIKNYLSFKSITLTNTNPITNLPEEYNKIDVAIKDSSTIETKNISEITIGKDGQFKFKLYCRDNALLQTGRHLGMFKDGVIHGGDPNNPIKSERRIIIEDMTDGTTEIL
jgi:phage terminase small subunit